MTTKHVIVLGAGSAGAAAARALTGREDVRVTLVARTGERPYTRMLIKGVAFGPTPAEVITLPLPEVELVADSVTGIDAATQEVRLASGERLSYDALIVATGSMPHTPPHGVADDSVTRSGRVSALHSLEDALRIRKQLSGLGRPARMAIYGGGIIAAESASTLHADGHRVELISRSLVPGIAAFGRPVAEHLAAQHRARILTRFGQTVRRIAAADSGIHVHLDAGAPIEADLLLLALGTTPAAPAPWTGGIDVDDRLRAGADLVYAAGGVAIHHHEVLGTWRIDHWDDASAQGAHAAGSALHGLGLAEDPGAYLPRSPYLATVHGQMAAGVGTTIDAEAVLGDGDEFVVRHEKGGTVVGVTGIDAVGTVLPWGQQLHKVPA